MRISTTIASRSILLFALLTPSLAAAETPTLADLFAALDADPHLTTARHEVAKAEKSAAPLETRLPGPGVGAGARVILDGESEIEVEVAQAFPLGRARRARAAARRAGADAIRMDAEQRHLELRAEVAVTFYDAVHRQTRLDVLKARRAELEVAHAALARREQAGDASPFDVERMGRELRQVTLRVQREELAIRAALLEIEALVPGTGGLAGVDGTLAPQCGATSSTSPRVSALEHRLQESEHLARAARAGNAPELETHAGWAAVLGPGELAQGFIVGIGLRVPFWGYGAYAEDRAAAQTRALAAEKALVEHAIAGRAERAARRCERLVAIAEEAESGVAATAQLVARANAGYAAAEISLLELVDAQRALLEDRLEQLEVLAEARAAEIELRAETGGWP